VTRQTDQPVTAPSGQARLFANHFLFRDLGPEIHERLSSYAQLKTVERGVTIFQKGDPGTSLFAVCSGTVQMTALSTSGKNAVFNLIREGEIFGEIALLDGKPRTADAVAFTDCTLMVIERRDFIPLLRSHPDMAIKLLELLCSRLRRTTEQVEDLLFLDLRSRLVKALAAPVADGAERGDRDLAGRAQPHRRHVARDDQQAAAGLGEGSVDQPGAQAHHRAAAQRARPHRGGLEKVG